MKSLWKSRYGRKRSERLLSAMEALTSLLISIAENSRSRSLNIGPVYLPEKNCLGLMSITRNDSNWEVEDMETYAKLKGWTRVPSTQPKVLAWTKILADNKVLLTKDEVSRLLHFWRCAVRPLPALSTEGHLASRDLRDEFKPFFDWIRFNFPEPLFHNGPFVNWMFKSFASTATIQKLSWTLPDFSRALYIDPDYRRTSVFRNPSPQETRLFLDCLRNLHPSANSLDPPLDDIIIQALQDLSKTKMLLYSPHRHLCSPHTLTCVVHTCPDTCTCIVLAVPTTRNVGYRLKPRKGRRQH